MSQKKWMLPRRRETIAPTHDHRKESRAWIELDREALAHNVSVLRACLPKSCRLMPAVKANAYGHGAVLVAKELEKLGVDAFCVACVQEGIELRQNGIGGEILVLGYTPPEEFAQLEKYQLTQTVADLTHAAALDQYGKRLHVHVAIDTGMHRLGESDRNTDGLCAVMNMKNLAVDGLFTHLCAADTQKPQDRAFTRKQAERFYRAVSVMKEELLERSNGRRQAAARADSGQPARQAAARADGGQSAGHAAAQADSGQPAGQAAARADSGQPAAQADSGQSAGHAAAALTEPALKLHLLASYGIFNYPEYAEDYARAGIALYGVSSARGDCAGMEELRPVLSLKARVACVKDLSAGETAGYGRAFCAESERRLAVLTIGYADGLPRSLSNGVGAVLIHGKKAPIAGRICMDQTIVDVSDIPEVRAGDTAVVIGRSGAEEITACDLAEQSGTITNEILSRLGGRLERSFL